MQTKNSALNLLHEYVQSDSLRKHCLTVATAMEAYAKKFQKENEAEKWWITGLLHDFDYEKYPSLEQHPFKGVEILKQNNYPEEIIEAILGHGNHTKIPRISLMAKTLFAVDELSGFIIALAKVRPNNFEGMSAESIKKALKKKDFAKAINREEIEQGIHELSISKEEHFETVIKALKSEKTQLGFQ